MAIGSYQLSVSVDLKGATTALKGLNAQLKAAQKPARDFQNQLKQFGRLSGLSDVGKAASSVARKIGTAGKAMAGFVGLASVAGLADMIKGFADMSQQVENLSGKLGIAADRLQALHGAGKLTGLGNALTATTQSVQDVQRAYNNGTASSTQQAAISSMGLNGRMSTDDYTKKALQRTKHDMDHGMSAATARARLSDAGVDPALMGLIEQAKIAHKDVAQYYDDINARAKLLLRTNQTSTEQGARLRQSFQGVGLAVEGFGNAIASKLAPALSPMLDSFANWLATSPQANEMITQISDGIVTFAKWIASINWQGVASGAMSVFNAVGGLKGIFEGLVALKVAGWATHAIGPANKLYTVFKKLGGVSRLKSVFLGTLSVVKTVGRYFLNFGNIVRIAGMAFGAITSPIGIAVAAVAALGVAAYELYQHWDTVGPYFRATWDTVKDIFSGVAKWLQPATDTIGSIFTTMWDDIKSAFSTAWDFISPIFDKIKGAFDWIANTSIGKKIGFIADDFSKNLANEKQVTADSIAARSDNSPAQVPAGVRAGGATGGGYKKAPDEVAALEAQGLSHANAVGYAANIMKESNFNPFAKGDRGAAYGLGQWHKDRQLAYAKMFGHTMQSVTDVDQARREQTQFYVAESKTATGGHVFQKLQGNNDVGVAAATVSRDFERPANQLGEMSDRARIAMNINNQALKDNNQLLAKANTNTTQLAQANDKQVQTQAQVASATINNNTTTTEKVQHSVDINVGDGRITAKAKSGGGGLTIAPPKVQKVMPSIIV